MNKLETWYDQDSYQKMIDAASGKLWPKLENSEHWGTLRKIIDEVSDDALTMLDLGCGAGELGRLIPQFFYVGADLRGIIDNVSVKVNPNQRYDYYDINNNPDVEYLKNFELIVCNAFIDVMEYPIEVLEKILSNAQKYVIVHRQQIGDLATHVKKYDSPYGGYTYQSYINRKELLDIIEKYDFGLFFERGIPSCDDARSFLLRKNDISIKR